MQKRQNIWFGLTPRDWQVDAVDIIKDDYTTRPSDRGAVVRASTGAGKSILMRAFVASLPKDATVLVVVPKVSLVEQITRTFHNDLTIQSGLLNIGQVYTKSKREAPVTVTTIQSITMIQNKYDVIIFDECHKSETARVIATLDTIKKAGSYIIGFSATPYRSKVDEKLSIFDRVIYTYGPADAIKDKVTVPYRILYTPQSDDLDFSTLWAVQDAIERVSGQIILSAKSINDAKEVVDMLNREGIEADLIHSRLKAGEGEANIEALKKGDIKVLVHISMLSEGVDLPWIKALISRRKVSSPIRLTQEIGRAVRSYPGKTEALWYDLHGVCVETSLYLDPALWVERTAMRLQDDVASDMVVKYALNSGYTKVVPVDLDEFTRDEAGEAADVLIISSLKDNSIDPYQITLLNQNHEHLTIKVLKKDTKILVAIGGPEVIKRAYDQRGWKCAWSQQTLRGLTVTDHTLVVETSQQAEPLRLAGFTVKAMDERPVMPHFEFRPTPENWVVAQHAYLQQLGLIEVGRKPLPPFVRRKDQSEKQRNYLQALIRKAGRRLNAPEAVKVHLREACKAGLQRRLRLGHTSDLISLMRYYTV